MLKVLQRLVQDVNAAQDLNEALLIIVRRVCETINAEACSVYLIDQRKKEYVLMATEGLNPSIVKRLRVKAIAAQIVGARSLGRTQARRDQCRAQVGPCQRIVSLLDQRRRFVDVRPRIERGRGYGDHQQRRSEQRLEPRSAHLVSVLRVRRTCSLCHGARVWNRDRIDGPVRERQGRSAFKAR